MNYLVHLRLDCVIWSWQARSRKAVPLTGLHAKVVCTRIVVCFSPPHGGCMFPSRFILVFSFSAPLGCGKEPLRSEQAVGFCLLVGQAGRAWFSSWISPAFLSASIRRP